MNLRAATESAGDLPPPPGLRAAAPPPDDDPLVRVLAEIAVERGRQDAKWGQQDHPNADPILSRRKADHARIAEEHEIPTATRARFLCDLKHKRGDGSWTDIVVEELCEAVEKCTDDTACREELVQTAACLVAWIECIDRRAR